VHDLLRRLRAARGFDVRGLAEAKVGRLAGWFAGQRLDAAVVGVSGGVDSALVLALLKACSDRPHSPLRRVVALLMPIGGRGAVHQERAAERGREVARALGADTWDVPLTAGLEGIVGSLARGSGLAFDAWAEGQCLSVVRTPALYGAAALLQAHGYRSVVVGTTNRDEGAYLGFFGKASDGMVDLQPISDLHKSEVRALAAFLGVPRAVVDAVPAGDVHDGRSDEEMIGAGYDEVEAFLRLLELGRSPDEVLESAGAIRAQHARNAHKYAVGQPAVHLDVLPRGVPGGWSDEAVSGNDEQRPPRGAIPGAWEPPLVGFDPPGWPAVSSLDVPGALVTRASGVLTRGDCARLVASMGQASPEPVGVTGLRDGEGLGVGSMRATAWAPELARDLWHRLRPAVPSVRFLDARTPTDHFARGDRPGHRTWRVRGLSPLLRFMRYDSGGRHLGHYDAAYDYGDGRRTLLSVVFFLTTSEGTGATRFLRDGQEELPAAARTFDDWSRGARDDEVVARAVPVAGDALFFDHRVCHDVERWDGPGPRIIVRGDVVYEAIPDGRS
jgi:NAD+ synthetase